jgi:copper chaperone CopZ
MSEPVTRTWTVAGMTCDHCVASVTEEVSELPGVRSVDVVLDGGRLTVESGAPLAEDDVRRAVEEAGYRLA